MMRSAATRMPAARKALFAAALHDSASDEDVTSAPILDGEADSEHEQDAQAAVAQAGAAPMPREHGLYRPFDNDDEWMNPPALANRRLTASEPEFYRRRDVI